jgi:hypothetical protein
MERWIAPDEEQREREHRPPPPPPMSLGRRNRPPHEIMFEGLEHLSAQIQQLEGEIVRLRQLLEEPQNPSN